MSEKKTIWAVSSGCYSDYGVDFVCATREIAEAFVREHDAARQLTNPDYVGEDYDGYCVEGFDFVDEPIRLYTTYTVRGHTRDGLEISVGSEATETKSPNRPVVEQHEDFWNKGHTTVEATCSDRDAAIKSVKDRLAALIARGSIA